jgi:hypothetical protein
MRRCYREEEGWEGWDSKEERRGGCTREYMERGEGSKEGGGVGGGRDVPGA